MKTIAEKIAEVVARDYAYEDSINVEETRRRYDALLTQHNNPTKAIGGMPLHEAMGILWSFFDGEVPKRHDLDILIWHIFEVNRDISLFMPEVSKINYETCREIYAVLVEHFPDGPPEIDWEDVKNIEPLRWSKELAIRMLMSSNLMKGVLLTIAD